MRYCAARTTDTSSPPSLRRVLRSAKRCTNPCGSRQTVSPGSRPGPATVSGPRQTRPPGSGPGTSAPHRRRGQEGGQPAVEARHQPVHRGGKTQAGRGSEPYVRLRPVAFDVERLPGLDWSARAAASASAATSACPAGSSYTGVPARLVERGMNGVRVQRVQSLGVDLPQLVEQGRHGSPPPLPRIRGAPRTRQPRSSACASARSSAARPSFAPARRQTTAISAPGASSETSGTAAAGSVTTTATTCGRIPGAWATAPPALRSDLRVIPSRPSPRVPRRPGSYPAPGAECQPRSVLLAGQGQRALGGDGQHHHPSSPVQREDGIPQAGRRPCPSTTPRCPRPPRRRRRG